MQTRLPVEWMLNPGSSENVESPRVLVIYDDIAAGKTAVRVLSRIFEQCGDTAHRPPMLWRFDLLDDLEWRSTALQDALKADLLVIAASRRLSGAVQRWIESCCAMKAGAITAIVTLFCSGENRRQDEIEFLEGTARDAGIDLFISENQSNCFEQSPRRNTPLLANAPAFLTESRASVYGDLDMHRYWGINE